MYSPHDQIVIRNILIIYFEIPPPWPSTKANYWELITPIYLEFLLIESVIYAMGLIIWA
jgi:hypothetical protein